MSTTIDSLEIQISTSAGQAERKISDLAEALGRLRENGKITVATNGLKKLAEALNELNPALNGMNATKLQQLRAAMGGLANLQKLTGLNSAVNTLKKLPEVITNLDAAKLDRFTEQMNKLALALKPLASELDKIGNGFAKLPANVTKAVSATNKMVTATEKAAAASTKQSAAINSTSLNLMTAISNFHSMIHAAQMVSTAISNTMAEAMEWDGIQYRFGRAFGEDAEEVYAYAQKINDVLGINIQQFMQYSSLYGSLLSGFGMAQDKVTTISVGLTELSYDIWAAYNDRFKSLEDASEAVRSAITGEIEPIRNAGIALTEASLQEYLDSVGMATVSIEKLSEAQKAEIRYAAMMNAAMNQGIVGTYASEMQTAEGAVRNLSQAWKGLVQAIGSLFIPLLQAAIPYVTAFVNLLYDAVKALAEFIGLSFFEIDWSGASSGSEDIKEGFESAAASAKKIRDYTMGFDELNIINPDSGSGGSGSSGTPDWGSGLDLSTMWDESVFAKASQQVDELKQKIKDWFEEWKTEIAIVAGALGVLSVANLLSSLGSAIGLSDDLLGKLNTLKNIAGLAIILTLQYSLQSEFLENFIEEGSWEDYVWFAVVGALGAFGAYLTMGKTGLILSLTITALTSLQAAFADGDVDSTAEVVTGLTGLASAAGALGLAWPKIKVFFDGVKEFFLAAKTMAPEVGWLEALFPKLSSGFASIGTWISGAASSVGTFLGGLSAPVWGTIVGVIAAIVAVVIFLKEHWDAVTQAVKDFFATNIAPKLEEIKGHWDNMKTALEPVGKALEWLIQPIKDLIEGCKEWWEATEPLTVLGDIFEVIGGVIFSVVSGVIMGAINGVIRAFEGLIQIISGLAQIVGGAVDLIVAIFTGDFQGILEAVDKIAMGIYDVFLGLWDMVAGPVIDFVDGVIKWFIELWDELVGHSIVPDTVEGIIDWFLSLPGAILKPIQDFVNDVLAKFKGLWTSLKSWWNTTVAPKLTVAYWKEKFNSIVKGLTNKWTEAKNWWNNNKPTLASVQATVASVKDKLSSAWTTAKNWWNSKPALSAVSATVNSIKDKLSGAWTAARTWWNSNKPTLASVQATVASVKEKLSSAWTTARTWWGSKPTLSSISVTVSSIKDKLVSAWNTAKNWFSQQSLKLNIKTPHFSVGWNYNIASWQAAIADFLFDKKAMPYLDVSWYAQGGMPAMGEMFVAREAGPELVGRIGSRNAVANNDQIVAAVSEGVYAAVVAAMKSSTQSGGNQAVNVYLDGKQITATVEQRQRERGATIMGSQVYSY